MMTSEQKPVIGFSCGDLNGIGLELIIKTLSDTRLTELCTPVVFASNKAINFYKKSVTDGNFSYQAIRDFQRLSPELVAAAARLPTATLPSSSSSRERRMTARIRASSSRAEKGLTT